MFRIDSSDGISKIKITDPLTNKAVPYNILAIGDTGSGKTLCLEGIREYHQRNGFVTISLTDVKNNMEQCFSIFPPKSPYHIQKLLNTGSPIKAIPTKIYHPFTFQIPNKKLPETNFYTINIKNLTRVDLAFLAESEANKRSIQIILDEIQKLKPHEGLHHLIFKSEEQTDTIQENTKIKLRSQNPDDFFSKTKAGTDKTASEIRTYFKPFLDDYTLTPQNNPTNLNIRQLINDPTHYHNFTYKYIKDPRQKLFYILHLIQEIINNAEHAKHPILLIVEEIKYLFPDTNEGYQNYLATHFNKTFLTMRNLNKHGIGMIMTSQSYRNVNKNVINTANLTITGKMTSLDEYEYTQKALKLNTQELKILSSLQTGEFAIKTTDEYNEPQYTKAKFLLPPHSHKDYGVDFTEEYEKKYPEKMTNYTNLKNTIQTIKDQDIQTVHQLVNQENQRKQNIIENQKRQPRQNQQIEKIKELKTEKQQLTQQTQQQIYQYHKEHPELNYQQLAQHFQTYKMKIKRIIDRLNQPNSSDDPTASSNENKSPETP